MRVALYTFGVFIEPAESPRNAGFHARNDRIIAALSYAHGFIARSGYEDDPGPPSWGKEIYPHFYKEQGDGWTPATLSLWQDLASPMAFAYHGGHNEALRHGRRWFQKPTWPPYVLWWVEDDHTPDWAEAVARHLQLHTDGPGTDAFTFAKPFDGTGRAMTIDQARVKALAEKNRTEIQKRIGRLSS